MFTVSSKNKLSNSTIKQIKAQFDTDLSILLGKEESLEIVKFSNKVQYIFRNGIPIFLVEEKYVPTLKCVHIAPEIVKKVVVDVGAIKHLINGADVMAPGLLHTTSEYPSVTEGELVGIYGYGKDHALATGTVLMTQQQVEELRTGVAIKLGNHLGDSLYMYSIN
ncbi:hypothetical protein NEDG_00434 [Nematocida displodere]|uniref:Translation machinery-associated protein 20 n=1 Tax=Nematocida displodere TaxID=1805483 RepID=A0A177ELV1_9MICR|nr:hypothetical protein NEDG_00434 [Nematocida displodere]